MKEWFGSVISVYVLVHESEGYIQNKCIASNSTTPKTTHFSKKNGCIYVLYSMDDFIYDPTKYYTCIMCFAYTCILCVCVMYCTDVRDSASDLEQLSQRSLKESTNHHIHPSSSLPATIVVGNVLGSGGGGRRWADVGRRRESEIAVKLKTNGQTTEPTAQVCNALHGIM